MRLRLLSDLHLEHWLSPSRLWSHLEDNLGYFRGRPDPAEVMCLCGDIGFPSDPNFEQLLGKFAARWPRTLMVAGHREYFKCDREYPLRQLRAVCDRSGVKLLDRERVELDGVSFLGCTLWSDVSYRDYWLMHDSIRVFTGHEDYLAAHARDRLWLANELKIQGPRPNPSRPTVVLTHHLPTDKLVHRRYRDWSQSGFVTPLDGLVAQSRARYWFTGHTHESMQARIDQTLCAVSPVGYPQEQTRKVEKLLDQAFDI